MNLETIRQYITSHLHTWDQSNTTKVIYDNRHANDIDTTLPFVKLNTNFGNAQTVSIDSGPKRRRTGTVTLQCFAPKNTGLKNLTLIVDDLVSHFEYNRSTNRKVWFGTSDVINVANDSFYQINININFQASDI